MEQNDYDHKDKYVTWPCTDIPKLCSLIYPSAKFLILKKYLFDSLYYQIGVTAATLNFLYVSDDIYVLYLTVKGLYRMDHILFYMVPIITGQPLAGNINSSRPIDAYMFL